MDDETRARMRAECKALLEEAMAAGTSEPPSAWAFESWRQDAVRLEHAARMEDSRSALARRQEESARGAESLALQRRDSDDLRTFRWTETAALAAHRASIEAANERQAVALERMAAALEALAARDDRPYSDDSLD